MKKPALAVLLPQQLPQEVHAFLADYLFQIEQNQFLLSHLFQVDGYFVSLDILKNDKSKKTWPVHLPIQFVLSVGQIRAEDEKKIGFVA